MAIKLTGDFTPADPMGLYKGKGNPLTQAQAPSSPTAFGALEGSPQNKFDTPLTASERKQFEVWKAKYAPGDSGEDYDLAGAFKAGLTPDPENGHFADTFKKPNHPTFSNQSKYAPYAPDLAGTWDDAGNYQPTETRARADAMAAADAQTRAAEGSFAQLDRKEPGRYKLISSSEFDAWQQEWDKKNRSDGLLGDTVRLLDAGSAELEQGINELVGMIPVIGKPLQKLADDFDQFAYGSDSYSERLQDVIDRNVATLTPDMQQARGEQWWNAETNSLGSAWLNPRSYYAGVVESLPSTLATMAPAMWMARGAYAAAIAKGVSQKVAAAAAAKTALIAGAITEGGLGGAQTSTQVRQSIAQMPREKLLETEAVKALIAQGYKPDAAIEAISSDAATQAFVMGGVATGLFGGFGDRFLAKIVAEGVGGGVARRIVEGAVRGIVSEGLLEEMPQEALGQVAQNLALKNTVSPEQDLLEGVPNAALGGAAIGAAMGAGMGGVAGGFRPAEDAAPVDPSAPEYIAPRPAAPAAPAAPKGTLATAVEHGIAAGGPVVDPAAAPVANPDALADVLPAGPEAPPVAGQTQVLPDAEPVPLSPVTVNTLPPEGANVVVEAEGVPRFTGKVQGYEQTEDGSVEALVSDQNTGELLQVPIETLRTAKLTDEAVAAMDRRDNPPIERPAVDPTDTTRTLGKRQVEFPDANHAALYDFGKQLQLNKGHVRTQGGDVFVAQEMDPQERQRIADEFGVLPDRVNEIADDYRYRADRAAKGDPGTGLPLNMHGLFPDKLKSWRQERRIAELEGKAAAPDAATVAPDAATGATVAPETIEAPALEAATSPTNDLPEPTPAQKEAGNYKLGHFVTGGLDISIENPAGSERKGTDKGGKPWSITLKSHYGYIKGTVGRDKDHVDVFVKSDTGELSDDAPVFVVDQNNAEGGWDEHKVMLGYKTVGQASNAYKANYTKGWKGLGAITPTTLGEFKAWLKDGDTAKPFVKATAKIADAMQAADTKASDAAEAAHEAALDYRAAGPGPAEEIDAKAPEAKAEAAVAPAEETRPVVNAPDVTASNTLTEDAAKEQPSAPKAARPPATVATKAAPPDIANEAEPAPKKAATPADSDQFAGNKLFTADKVAAARARLKAKMGQLNSGIDPEVLIDGMTIAGAYIEAGVRNFSEYAAKMAGDFGDGINPYLLSFWEGARNYPGLDTKGMTSAEDSARAHAALVTTLPASEAPALGSEVAKPKTRTKRTSRPEDRILTQDWGVDHIDGYGTDPSRDEGNDVKDAFLKDGAAYFRQVANILTERGFTMPEDRKGKPVKAVSSNQSGPATSGDINLSMRLPETGVNIRAHIAGSSLRGTVPTSPSGVSLMYRVSGLAGDRYAADGTNRWAATTLTAGEFADMIATEAMGTVPGLSRPALEVNNDSSTADNARGPSLGEADRGGGSEVPSRRNDDPQPGPASPYPGDVEADQPDNVGPTVSAQDRPDAGLRGAAEDVAGKGRPDEGRAAIHRRAGDGGAGATDAGTGDGTARGAGTGVPRAGKPRDDLVELGDGLAADPATTSPAHAGPGNFLIADPLEVVGGGPVARFDKNKAAITLYLSLKDEGRNATREEQQILAGYTGWGSFGQELFQGTWARRAPKPAWEARDAWLREHLGQAEWESAQRSITNAHYTDPPTVLAMWNMVKRMGFDGGRVLEPSMGIGNFFGMMPPELAGRSGLTGIELDSLTGGMAQQLYPDANISVMGYQESRTPDGFYDVVIGNWPFEDTVIADRRYNRLSPYLHDYFFLKAVDQVRPGGLVIGITSKGTLDKKDPSIRNAIDRKAELVAAFRLPSGAFEEYAGTAVVTDIVILRKRAEETGIADGEWLQSKDYTTPTGEVVSLNSYYHAHPDHVIGTIAYGHGTTFKRPGMIVQRPDDMAAQLERIIKMVPEGAYLKDTRAEQVAYITNHTADREGALTESKGAFYVVRGEHMAPADGVAKYAVSSKVTTAAREDQFKRLIALRKAYADLISQERDPAADAEKARTELRRQYEDFNKAHGRLRTSYGLNYLDKINDPFYPALAALEAEDGASFKPAAILSKSTMRAAKPLTNPSVTEAFVLARQGAVDPSLAKIAELAKKPEAEVRAELLEAGAVFDLPNGDITPADVYLSGNVREKLRQALAGLEAGVAGMQRNIDALRAVVPADIPYFNIEVQFGASWVSTSSYEQYVAHMLNAPDTKGIKVTYNAGRWRIELDGRLTGRAEASAGFGTTYIGFSKLVNAAIGNESVRITSKDSDGNMVLDPKGTEEANLRIAKIREEFGEWLWSDPDRRVDTEREYNEVRNAYAVPSFDGSFLTFQGMALSLGRGPFDLRQHQVNAIWRALVTRKSLNAHEVGTGKTFTMGGIAVESRRYGIAKKPLIFAHNANSKSVAAEIQQMYPAAKVLYIDNLTPAQIDIRMRQIANDDWDAVVVPHSLIDRFALTEATLMKIAAEEIAALEAEAIAAAKEDGGEITDQMFDDPEELKKLRSPTAKDLVKTRNRIIESIKKQAQRSSREGAVTFEDLGVDMVMVDEAHEFKKPPFSTRMKIKGLQTQTSAQSIALDFLTKYIRANNNGGNVHLFTGTPVTNTLTEVFHMMRYIMAEEMADVGVDQWDGWFGSFAKEVPDVELNAAAELESVTRLAGFINVPELRRLFGQYMDVVFSSDMPEMQPRQTKSGKTLDAKELTEAERAELLNGRTENAKDRPYKQVIISNADLTTQQDAVFKQVQAWAKAFRNMSGKAKRETMQAGGPESPIIYEGVAKIASFDVRLRDGRENAGREGHVPDNPQSKASRVVANVLAVYKSHRLANQVIFTDTGISTTGTKSLGKDPDGNKRQERFKTFSTVRDIVARLVAAGIPREQIATVDGSTSRDKRKDIAGAMNTGEVRVVIGSTDALGVGVNMQRNLRAMHHMDAPWMPGELEQRNGRGQRQANQWNTVQEYRYLTDRIDGRRWQVLAIKQRFITAFLKADDKTRVIEGDAVGDADNDIMQTFAEAAGDPRLMIREKLRKKIEQLKRRQTMHGAGIVDAGRSARRMAERNDYLDKEISRRQPIADQAKKVIADNAAKAFTIKLFSKSLDARADANAAINAYVVDTMRIGQAARSIGTFGGHDVSIAWGQFNQSPNLSIKIGGEDIPALGPTIPSLEAAIRHYPESVERMETERANNIRSIARMEEVAKEPFQRAGDLEAAVKQFDGIAADMAANPVPPPSWLRSGAPVDTEVQWNGKGFDVVGHRWASDGWYVLGSDANGEVLIPYAEAKDGQGMQIYEERPFVAPEVIEKKDENTGNAAVPKDAEMSAAPAGWDSVEASEPRRITATERDELVEIVREVSGLKDVGTMDTIPLPLGAPGWGSSGPTTAGGFYSPTMDAIVLAEDSAGPRTAYHESFHRLQNLFLTASEKRVLAEELPRLRRIVNSTEARRGQAGAMARKEIEAEAFAVYATDGSPRPHKALAAAWDRIAAMVRRVRNFLAGNGFTTAEDVFAAAKAGTIASRTAAAPSGSVEFSIADAARDPVKTGKAALGAIGGRWTDVQPKLLATVPLTYFAELARPTMTAVKAYLQIKRNMDAYRGNRHAEGDALAQEWLKYSRLGFGLLPNKAGKAAAATLADLMHASTLAGIDPSATDKETTEKYGYEDLRARYMALPRAGQALFNKVRDAYVAQAAENDKLIIDAIRKAQDVAKRQAAEEYETEVARINKSRATQAEKELELKKLTETHAKAMMRSTYANKARLTALRKAFEANRVPAPYFPLARFGRYTVTLRDVTGEIASFSLRETSAEAQKLARDMREAYPQMTVETGVTDKAGAGVRQAMDPRIIAEIESILGKNDVDPKVMDAIWQRYLQSMPDLSTRKKFIHRKGTAGFDADALRAFSSHMFHAAHQMARLKYGVDLQEMLSQAAIQARNSDDPTKGTTLINELGKRHEWVMNPTGSQAVQAVTSAMFVWYLAATPAAALVNLTQTPMLGIPILGARFGAAKTTTALLKAARDFAAGRGDAAKATTLTIEERWAMGQFHESGLIDRTQSHDLAGVGDTGVNYSPLRARVMAIIAWGFHKTEVANREVTALAAFRLAKEAGQGSMQALDTAHDLTWRIHFDYSNSSRPRAMQGDVFKLLFVFQTFQVNMWYRIARDLHQAFKGQSPQARKEARYQLAGIAGMMALMGGVTGFFGFHAIMAILGMFLGDEDDPYDFETQAKRHVIEMFGPDIGGMILNGVPGQLLGVDLTSRVGMPDILIRAPDRANLDGRDWLKEFIVGALGVVPNTAINMVDGFGLIQEGKLMRGLELMAPKAFKDMMQAYRFANEGVTTRRGDEIISSDLLGGWTALSKMMGFTPAKVAEAYDRNSALMNAQTRVMDHRSVLLNQFAMAIEMGDDEARQMVLDRIRAFNANPINRGVAITADTIRRSMTTRRRNTEKRQDGVLIQNEELGRALRALQPARVN